MVGRTCQNLCLAACCLLLLLPVLLSACGPTPASSLEQAPTDQPAALDQPAASDELERQRLLRDVELEGRQKIWRWLIALALVVIVVETAWAARHSRRPRKVDAHD